MNRIDQFIQALEGMQIVNESAVGIFLDDPIEFINNYQYTGGATPRDDPDRLGIICIDGAIYLQVIKICSDLKKVGAYSSALTLIDTFMEKLEHLKKDPTVNSSWKLCIDSSLSELYDFRLKTLEERDDEQSRREAVLAKYNGIINRLIDGGK